MIENPKLAYTPKQVVELTPWGKTKINELIQSGELPSRFRWGHRYVMHADLMAALLAPELSVPAQEETADAA